MPDELSVTDQRALQLREAAYGPILRAEFQAQGLPPEWGMAFGYVESGFKPDAFRGKGGDKARGGAWGICQMTLLTAQELGFKGQPEAFFNPSLCAHYAALLVKSDLHRTGNNFLNVAACYNGGHSTYVGSSPKAKAYADFINEVMKRYAIRFRDEFIT